MSYRLEWIIVTAFASSLVSGIVCAGDVVNYDRVPGADEIRRQLGSLSSTSSDTYGKPEKYKPKIKSRSIVFDSPPEAPSAVNQKVAVSVDAPDKGKGNASSMESKIADLANAASKESVSTPKEQSKNVVQISKQAISFPIKFLVNSSEVLPESLPYLESIANLLKSGKDNKAGNTVGNIGGN